MAIYGATDLFALDKLLSDDAPTTAPPKPAAAAAITPASIGPPVSQPPKKATDKNAIWAEEEVSSSNYYNDPSDKRQRPEYDLRFKQRLGTNDMFLGMDFDKDPSTMKAEELVIAIELPGTDDLSDVQCDVKETLLDVRSSKYKLILPLPRKVYPNKGNAKWDGKTQTLTVTCVCNYEHYITKIM
eukprot:NODE_7067_length_796_cov_126.377415_g6828_i0.p1 GENE.NODE_7067_length_796_cov_126.377415_g6828_i0~~NODE_7067_length_796_cov_126.377415_g6828_i0.p1  ORF type:complete len:185 (-),score=34.49 NODE_7067_length_796_cov_126.377415_g6828_i0:167-721(-)